MQIRKLGYPFRCLHATFFYRFYGLLPKEQLSSVSYDKSAMRANAPRRAS